MLFFPFRAGIVAITSLVLLNGSPVQADTLVAPNNLTSSNANNTNGFPLVGAEFQGGGSLVALHYQEVFSSSQFAALTSGGGLISALAFRPALTKTPAPQSISYSSFRLALSTTASTPDGLSTIFGNNFGPDNRLVYDGPITFSTAEGGPASGPHFFDLVIPLQTPFFYNPLSGNLLLDLRLNGPNTGSTSIVVDDQNTAGDSISRVVAAYGFDDPYGPVGRASTQGAVVQFTFSVVPEPKATVIILVGVGAVLLRWWQRRERSA